MKLTRVLIRKIKIPPNYPRTRVENIKGDKTILTPILLDSKYNLIDGLRRIETEKKKGKKSIWATVRNSFSKDHLEEQLIIDAQRNNLNPIEKAKALSELMRRNNLSMRKTAKILGIDKSVVELHIKLLDLPSRIQKKIYEGKLKAMPLQRIVYGEKIKTVEEFEKRNEDQQYQSLHNRITALKRTVSITIIRRDRLQHLREKLREVVQIINEKIDKQSIEEKRS